MEKSSLKPFGKASVPLWVSRKTGLVSSRTKLLRSYRGRLRCRTNIDFFLRFLSMIIKNCTIYNEITQSKSNKMNKNSKYAIETIKAITYT